VLLAVAAGCQPNIPECRSGELRFDGRPPRRLFAYDTTCREDCFSLPRIGSDCDAVCDPIISVAPAGVLRDDRSLSVVDFGSLGNSKALVYAFEYVDEAGGTAPDGWGFVAADERTYLSDQLDATARFVMTTFVMEFLQECPGGVCDDDLLCVPHDNTTVCAEACDLAVAEPCARGLICEPITATTGACNFSGQSLPLGGNRLSSVVVGELLTATPGRLELFEVSSDRLAGRFFLAWETPTKQPQGQVNGCFDLTLSAAIDFNGQSIRLLGP